MVQSGQFEKLINEDFSQYENDDVLNSLFKGYERAIFHSILTSFGLDVLIKDQYGGDVDTVYNVNKIDIDKNLTYKMAEHANDYDSLSKYTHDIVSGYGTNYEQIKRNVRIHYGENNRANTVNDEYENKPLHFLGKGKNYDNLISQKAELDHVVPAAEIYRNRGRVLAGLSTKELADNVDNLKWTNAHLNRSMKDESKSQYINEHPELSDDTKARITDADNQARATINHEILKKYYFDFENPNCRSFYMETAKTSARRGLQMGIREATGFLMIELWSNIREKIQNSDGTAKGTLSAINEGTSACLDKARNHYKELFELFGEGVLSGVLASITNTITNTFMTTSECTGRIIRQSWATVVEATNVLLFNTEEKYFCDRMTSAAKIIASGASVVVGTMVQESTSKALVTVPIPAEIKNIISTFTGTLCTGLLSVTLLIYIDNDPFGNFLEQYYGHGLKELKKQNKLFNEYCAKLQNVKVDELNKQTHYIYMLSEKMSSTDNDYEVNALLKKAANDLNLKPLWKDSLDDRIRDPNWTLTFSK